MAKKIKQKKGSYRMCDMCKLVWNVSPSMLDHTSYICPKCSNKKGSSKPTNNGASTTKRLAK